MPHKTMNPKLMTVLQDTPNMMTPLQLSTNRHYMKCMNHQLHLPNTFRRHSPPE
jgi:hypothetical protein